LDGKLSPSITLYVRARKGSLPLEIYLRPPGGLALRLKTTGLNELPLPKILHLLICFYKMHYEIFTTNKSFPVSSLIVFHTSFATTSRYALQFPKVWFKK